ncbi:transcription factor gte4 [Phtheirospermum japonicum]|uniref:Transcription factor gte4 n=1 Tax=Phtheirospermum japonicum TaxID=374723 RepID=A0A830AX28_9LAMI|nr:transcription factor gte4 [Phtheirospermum japonicum]
MLGGENEGSKEAKKSGERKVYSRKSLENSISSSNLQSKGEAIVSAGLGSDNFSDPSRDGGLIVNGGFLSQENKVRIGLPMKSKRDVLELRKKLEAERDLVRSLMSRIDKVGMGNVEKEKRTLKANKFYRNSEFLLAKDKLPSVESKKKSKKSKENFPIQVFKSCNALLEKLMKHKHGWVFNTPVDVVGLGLHDYFVIIREPMDLGTVKNRLTQSWYKSPMEFAEDVRLTFRNAMTYNPKGQDVYVMAEQLSKIFEDKWADMKKTIDIPESIDPKRKTMDAVVAQPGKVPVLKKPKAKDPDKREMTYDEKHKLSVNLQDLPSEKLENVVQIIKKRNSSVSQQDDEIEVDIDSVDTETLWELDRFITNYKKSLSKNKRKAEDVSPQVVTGLEKKTVEEITPAVVAETPKESRTNEERVVSPPVEVAEPRLDDTKQGARKSSSGSDSGSSSSGSSDVESSSADGSDGHHSPNN